MVLGNKVGTLYSHHEAYGPKWQHAIKFIQSNCDSINHSQPT